MSLFADRSDAGRRLAEALRPYAAQAPRAVALERPAGFRAVGQAYADFSQLTEDDVLALLRRRATP